MPGINQSDFMYGDGEEIELNEVIHSLSMYKAKYKLYPQEFAHFKDKIEPLTAKHNELLASLNSRAYQRALELRRREGLGLITYSYETGMFVDVAESAAAPAAVVSSTQPTLAQTTDVVYLAQQREQALSHGKASSTKPTSGAVASASAAAP